MPLLKRQYQAVSIRSSSPWTYIPQRFGRCERMRYESKGWVIFNLARKFTLVRQIPCRLENLNTVLSSLTLTIPPKSASLGLVNKVYCPNFSTLRSHINHGQSLEGSSWWDPCHDVIGTLHVCNILTWWFAESKFETFYMQLQRDLNSIAIFKEVEGHPKQAQKTIKVPALLVETPIHWCVL